MKPILLSGFMMIMVGSVLAQVKQNPVVPTFGGIYDIEEATMKPDADLPYKIVIDVVSGPDAPHELNPALNNVARMLNLHTIGGAPAENLDVVLAIHGDATMAIVDHDTYEDRFDMANPNVLLVEALSQAGVRLTVCGQSLIGRRIDTSSVLDQVEIATSMLTTMTTHQLKGYAALRF